MKFNISLLSFLNSKTKVKIVKFLLTHEAAMSEREIASILKVSHMSINRTLRKLSEINLVNYVTVGKAHLWKVNRESYAFTVLSEIINDIHNIEDPLKDLKTTITENIPKPLIEKVVLFGSITRGSEKINSDIDVFILVENSQRKKEIEDSMEKLSNICFDRYGNRLAPYILTKKEMQQRKRAKIVSEVNKGIQLFP